MEDNVFDIFKIKFKNINNELVLKKALRLNCGAFFVLSSARNFRLEEVRPQPRYSIGMTNYIKLNIRFCVFNFIIKSTKYRRHLRYIMRSKSFTRHVKSENWI